MRIEINGAEAEVSEADHQGGGGLARGQRGWPAVTGVDLIGDFPRFRMVVKGLRSR